MTQRVGKGIADYIAIRNIDIMFGYTIFPDTYPKCLAYALFYLHRQHFAQLILEPKLLSRGE